MLASLCTVRRRSGFRTLEGYNFSVAAGVGFIALAGVAAEFGVVMLLYLRQAIAAAGRAGGARSRLNFSMRRFGTARSCVCGPRP